MKVNFRTIPISQTYCRCFHASALCDGKVQYIGILNYSLWIKIGLLMKQ